MKPILTVALAFILTTAASAKVIEKFSQTYPLEANGSISLDNVNGSVEIVAWDKAEVSLEAEKGARDEEALARIQLKIDSTPGKLRIKTERIKTWKFWDNFNAYVNYKLMVPAGATLDKIDVVNARVRITGIKGFVNVDAVNGSIDAQDLSGPGRFDTVNGSIEVSYAAMPASSDEISLDTVNGSCTLTLPAGAAFTLHAETVNGGVSSDFPLTLEKSSKRELRGKVNGGGSKVILSSVNGGLAVDKAN